MYFLIITFGLMLAMRGARPAAIERPALGAARAWREAADFFLTVSVALVLWAIAEACKTTQFFAREFALLGPGLVIYLLARYQKKTDVFLLTAVAVAFMIRLKQADLWHGLSLVWAVSVGLALFQTCFLGLRYKLLFSRVPGSMKGWPVLCLLAAFISLVLGSLGRLVF